MIQHVGSRDLLVDRRAGGRWVVGRLKKGVVNLPGMAEAPSATVLEPELASQLELQVSMHTTPCVGLTK